MTAASATFVLFPALGLLWLFLRGDMLGRWRRGAAWRRYPAWIARAWTLFGAGSLTLLAIGGDVSAIATMPDRFLPARATVATWVGVIDPFGPMGAAAIGGILLGGIVAGLVERRGRRMALGDVERVLPRDRREWRWSAALALSAGVTEELYFRLLLPLLIAAASGSAALGFIVAVIFFAAAHRYQGWAGIAATGAVGVLMTIVYLSTASLIAAMLLHVAIDLNALVLRPVVTGRLSSSAAIPS